MSGYVTSFNGLPEVLRLKHLRPFCTFSKGPSIGVDSYSSEKVQEALNSGTVIGTKWDDNTKTFVDDVPAPEVLRRHFPKCTGFSYADHSEKLRVYSFVFFHFSSLGITHKPEDLDKIHLKDIPFPIRLMTEKEVTDIANEYLEKDEDTSVISNRVIYGRYLPNELENDVTIKNVNPSLYEEWSYIDKYASLVAYRYFVLYGITPDSFVRTLDSIYANLRLKTLKLLYILQNERKLAGLDISETLVHDLEYLKTLPFYFDDLTDVQFEFLSGYGIDVYDLYSEVDVDGECHQCYNYFSSLYALERDLQEAHERKVQTKYEWKVKSKKVNEYKAGLKPNRRFNMPSKPVNLNRYITYKDV